MFGKKHDKSFVHDSSRIKQLFIIKKITCIETPQDNPMYVLNHAYRIPFEIFHTYTRSQYVFFLYIS